MDGTRIPFDGNYGKTTRVEVPIGSDPADDFDPAWSPDAGKLVFTSYRAGATTELYAMNANGANPTRLTMNTAFDFAPAWSPRP